MNRIISPFIGILMVLAMILGLPAIAFANSGGNDYAGSGDYAGPGGSDNTFTCDFDVFGSVYGGRNFSSDAMNNSVTVVAGRISGNIFGGNSEEGHAAGNSVTMSGGTVGGDAYGGHSDQGNATENSVTMSGGTVGGDAYGGYAQEGDAAGNKVTMTGGTVADDVIGGMAYSGNATGNTVVLDGGTITSNRGSIYGGITYSNYGDATRNTVVLGAHLTGNLANISIYGGSSNWNNSTVDVVTGNMLRVYSKGLAVRALHNFEHVQFTLPENIAPNDTLLAVGSWFDLTGMDISVTYPPSEHKAGDTITLIDNVTGTPRTVSGDEQYEIKVVGNKLILTWLRSSPEPTLEFSSDNHGDIVDWTFRGDADCDQHITANDAKKIQEYYLNFEELSPDSSRELRNADANDDGKIDTQDASCVRGVRNGEIQLPDKSDNNALSFEVKDAPKDGYQIAAVTVNGKEMDLPAKGGSATTKVGDVTYSVTIDADGKVSVSGKYLEKNKIEFQHDACDDIIAASISFSSDKYGTIEDWTFRGDADADQKITAEDWKKIKDDLNDTNYPDYYLTTERQLRNADADANGEVNPNDWKLIKDLVNGNNGVRLPFKGGITDDAFTFEVKDAPKDGYQIAMVTVNGKPLDVPAKGKSAATKVGDVTYTVTIGTDGKGSVFGKNLKENVIAFAHEPIVTPKGNDDPPGDKPTEEEFGKTVTATNTDGDFAGSTFGHLRARGVAKGKKKVQIKWTDPKLGAAKFILYGNRCNTKGKKYTYVKMKEFSAGTYKYIPTDIHGQKLKKGTYYKFLVAAVNKNGRVIAVSKTVHVTTNGGKKGNDKSVKRVKPTKKAKYTLNVGKTKKLKVKEVKGKKKVARHRAVAWESSNPNIATVSKKGKVAAKGKGVCTIYAYAQNGVYTTFTITVK